MRQLCISHELFNVLLDGMTAFFNVTQCYRDTYFETPRGRTKKYYIAAEEITWNYMTEGKDLFSATDMNIDHGFSRYIMLVLPSPVILYKKPDPAQYFPMNQACYHIKLDKVYRFPKKHILCYHITLGKVNFSLDTNTFGKVN